MLGGLGSAVAVFVLSGSLWAQGALPPTGRVAGVDIGVVFTEYQRMKDINEELKQLEERLQAENEQRRQKNDGPQPQSHIQNRRIYPLGGPSCGSP